MSAATNRIKPVPTPAQDATVTTVDSQQSPLAEKPVRKGGRRLLMLALPLLLVLAAGGYWLIGGRYITTDNAYVHQPMVAISSDVPGRIVAVDVVENEHIPVGAPLFAIDPEPYQIALDQANAALASARQSVGQLRAAYHTARAQLDAARSIMEIKQRELERQQSLADRGLSAPAALDEASVAAQSAENSVQVAQSQLDAAAAGLGGDPDIDTDATPAVRAALASRDAAARNLDNTQITAQVPGIVAQIGSLNVGNHVAAGGQIATLVQSDNTWIDANFKETQLGGIVVGQPVTVEVDAYPDAELHGKVESIGSATGSQFSLIPTQNATGNWVKVVQRLSVRVSLDDTGDVPLRNGMSATVSVDTGHSHLDDLR